MINADNNACLKNFKSQTIIYILPTDVNECDTNEHNCDQNAYCVNTFGSFDCTCRRNFAGNGTYCVPIGKLFLFLVCFVFSFFFSEKRLTNEGNKESIPRFIRDIDIKYPF